MCSNTWTTIADHQPLEWMDKLGDQLLFVHLKDLRNDTPLDYTVFEVEKTAFMELGTGIIDFQSILTKARSMGIKYAFIDQDHTQLEKLESEFAQLKGTIGQAVTKFQELSRLNTTLQADLAALQESAQQDKQEIRRLAEHNRRLEKDHKSSGAVKTRETEIHRGLTRVLEQLEKLETSF